MGQAVSAALPSHPIGLPEPEPQSRSPAPGAIFHARFACPDLDVSRVSAFEGLPTYSPYYPFSPFTPLLGPLFTYLEKERKMLG